MEPVLIIRHVAHEGPGYLQVILDRENIPFSMICIDKGELIPNTIKGISGLVLMGGPMSINDPLGWINDEVQLVKQALASQLPILGHCLGGQMIAKAMGAKVRANPVSEIGWHVTRTVPHPETQWLREINEENLLFHWHSETFELPEGAVPILTSRYCEHQGFVCGKTLALQCHIEMTADMVSTWCELNQESLHPSDSVQTVDEMQDGLDEKINHLNQVADIMYLVWIKGLK